MKIFRYSDLPKLEFKELSNPKVLEQISALVVGTYVSYEADEIIPARNILDDLINRADSELGLAWQYRDRYVDLRALLSFGMLFRLEPAELSGVIKNHLLYILGQENSIIDRFKYAINIWSVAADDYRSAILAALTNNQLLLGQVTVSDWIKDYDQGLVNNQRSSLSEISYINESNKVKDQLVDQEDKNKLRTILSIYDWLKVGGPLPGEMVFSELRNRKESITPEKIVSPQALDIEEEVVAPMPKQDSESQIKPVVSPMPIKQASEKAKVVPKPTILPPKIELPQINSSTFIHNSPQTLKSTKPALIFDLEDEKEADKHREKAGGPPVLEHVLRQYIDDVIKDKNLVFKDEVNRRRFVQLMVSRLKDVRGPLEVAESLRKAVEAGGLGMPEEKADQVQQIMETAKQEFENKKKQGELKASLPEPLPRPEPVKVQVPKPAFDAEAAKKWREQMLREIQTQGQPVAANQTGSAPVLAPKPQLVDVKAPPKVVGPLEELRGLTLVDFRRLGSSPQEALQKIKGKIDLLGETSIGRKLEAVKAWKTSVVYQQYLRLGRESIEQGKPISAIVSNHQNLGEPVLTEGEFTAIADFNARLRF